MISNAVANVRKRGQNSDAPQNGKGNKTRRSGVDHFEDEECRSKMRGPYVVVQGWLGGTLPFRHADRME